MGSEIKAIEYSFPKNKISNSDLSLMFPDYDFSKFETKIGIKNRYWVDENETALDLAIAACEKVFKFHDRKSIDYIIYCTQSPEYHLPTTACILQNKLNCSKSTGALDINLGCSGYVYGLSLAKALINSNQAKNVLLVTAETYSKYLHPNDRSNRAIFGDGATASLISYNEDDLIGDFLFGTDGSGFDKLIVKNGCSRNHFDVNSEIQTYGTGNSFTDNHLYMNGPEIFNFTSEVIPNFTLEVLQKNNTDLNSTDQLIFHQANAFMLGTLRKKIRVEDSKFFIDLLDGGNTVSNTIPIALKKYCSGIDPNRLYSIALVGFGVGLSWAGCLIKINSKL
jgi:3-oxoacyl-[acyl-carrier-protein] synthase-3